MESSLMTQASWPWLSSVLAVCLSRRYLPVQCVTFSVLILIKLCLYWCLSFYLLDIFIVVFSSLMEILPEPQSRGFIVLLVFKIPLYLFLRFNSKQSYFLMSPRITRHCVWEMGCAVTVPVSQKSNLLLLSGNTWSCISPGQCQKSLVKGFTVMWFKILHK